MPGNSGYQELHLRGFTSDLRATLNGKELPEDIKARLLKMHEDNVVLKEQLSTTQAKLSKAKNVSYTISLQIMPF